MKQIKKYLSLVAVSFLVAAPAFAATLVLPTPPPGGPAPVKGSDIVNIITTAVNYLITVSTVIAIGMFIYGAIKYAMGDAKATETLKNSAWALLAILGIGLLVNTIAGLVNRGLQLG